jgi:REP element-mobilizing transposase RayT
MAPRSQQMNLDLPPRFGWGGARPDAGRKPLGEQAGMPHRSRVDVDPHTPLHVTLRAREHVWNLRSLRCYRIIAAALRGVAGRTDFRVVHFSVQGNHVHFVIEADDARALASGMKAVSGRIALGLNALMERRGPVFSDRYHAHPLRTPTEVRNALGYVLGNFSSHAVRRGGAMPDGYVDRYSSAAARCPDGEPPPVNSPRTWLLRVRGVAGARA